MDTIVIRKPDDMHHHFRDGDALAMTVPLAAKQFRRCVAMPNLTPPITTTEQALQYRQRILQYVPKGIDFEPLMTLYLTENTTPEEIKLAHDSGKIYAAKLYPVNVTTNSEYGVISIEKIYPVFREMERLGMLLLIHGEYQDDFVDVFDQEKEFLIVVLPQILQFFPSLKIVLEHISTCEAADFVLASENVAATITPQHLLYHRNDFLKGGLKPHLYCLPIIKKRRHRKRLIEMIQSGNEKFFLGTDSAPHTVENKECKIGCAGVFSSPIALQVYAEIFIKAECIEHFEAFSSQNGAKFYGLNLNEERIVLKKQDFLVPTHYRCGDSIVIPLKSEEKLDWTLVTDEEELKTL